MGLIQNTRASKQEPIKLKNVYIENEQNPGETAISITTERVLTAQPCYQGTGHKQECSKVLLPEFLLC